MNGARSIFMRKGYWLTALAAIVLLAASPGTALAQNLGIESVKVDAANSDGEVDEGVTTAVTVTLTDDVPSNMVAEITLAVVPPTGETQGDEGIAEIPANNAPGGDLVLANTRLVINGGNDTGSMTLLTVDDIDAVDEEFRITAVLTIIDQVTSDEAADRMEAFGGEVIDDETQEYEFDVTTDEDDVMEGDSFQVTLEADPERPANEPVTLFLRAPRGYTLTVTAPTPIDRTVLTNEGLTFTDTIDEQTINVAVKSNDENRDDDVITLEALMGTVASNKPVGTSDPITVLDIHQLPTDISGDAYGADEDGKETDTVVNMVAEGGKAFLYVTVVNERDDRVFDDEDFTVTPSLSGSQVLDARIMPTSMDVSDGDEGSGGKTVVGPFTLEAVNDEDIGMETLMVSLDVTGGKDSDGDAYGSGTSSGPFEIDITDMTAPLISVNDGAYDVILAALGDAVNTGDVITLMTADLFDVAEGYTGTYGASSDSEAVSTSASGTRVTVTADAVGDAKVTVTGTARMLASGLIVSQTVSNVAELTFPVMVTEAAMPEPVPALPLIAQWLLGLGLMGGGARQLFRRRRQG